MNFIDLDECTLGLESYQLPEFEIEKEFAVAFENFNGLFEGLKTVTAKQIQKPAVQQALMHRVEMIGSITGVSTEGMVFDPTDTHYGVYSTEAGVFEAIKKWVLKIINWIIDAFIAFFNKVKTFFSGKWRKAKAASDNNTMRKAMAQNETNKREGKTDQVVSEVITVGLPGAMMMVFHTQRHFPKSSIKFTGKMLEESNKAITGQFNMLTEKMTSDITKQYEGCTELVNASTENMEQALRTATTAISSANGVRGLMDSNFHCCGFEIHAVPLNSKLFKTTTGCKLAPLKNLIQEWNSQQITLDLDLRQYEKLNSQIETNADTVEGKLKVLADRMDTSQLKRQLKRLRDDIARTRDLAIGDDDVQAAQQFMVDKLSAIQQYTNMSFNNVGMSSFFHAKYSETLRKLMSLIATAVDGKVSGTANTN